MEKNHHSLDAGCDVMIENVLGLEPLQVQPKWEIPVYTLRQLTINFLSH